MKRPTLISAAALALLAAVAAAQYDVGALALGGRGTLGQGWQPAQMSSQDLCYALGYAPKPDGQC